ncbi:hypothetical protein P7K49_004822 [Saguinus oedipus]|uniref:Uncharacterized protein n=1 Tax=Saguinus oedipus TaxID=9490 RepID=A0ABQ9W8K1_SAGOE|nr:hypothetical protein P7K49_004822 [Saguinus oedipus]
MVIREGVASGTGWGSSKREERDEDKEGNNHMKEENYAAAVDCYTQAIELDSNNAVYYCNSTALSPVPSLETCSSLPYSSLKLTQYNWH